MDLSASSRTCICAIVAVRSWPITTEGKYGVMNGLRTVGSCTFGRMRAGAESVVLCVTLRNFAVHPGNSSFAIGDRSRSWNVDLTDGILCVHKVELKMRRDIPEAADRYR